MLTDVDVVAFQFALTPAHIAVLALQITNDQTVKQCAYSQVTFISTT